MCITRMSPPTRRFLGVEGKSGLAEGAFLVGAAAAVLVLDLGFLAGMVEIGIVQSGAK